MAAMATIEGKNSARRTARIAGALFITATVASILGFQVILSPILKAPNLLASVAASRTQLILGILIDAINSAVVVIIPVLLFPILRKHNEALALGYFGSRVIESVVLIIGHISLLVLATLGQEYAQAAAPGAPYLQTLGALLLAVSDWAFLLGPGVAFGLTALILNYLLYRSRLVPIQES